MIDPNMRDPIDEWENAIKKRIVSGVSFLPILAIGFCLIAPIFGPYIKARKRLQYVMFEDYEARTNAYMRIMYPILWIVAILGWWAVYYCYTHR